MIFACRPAREAAPALNNGKKLTSTEADPSLAEVERYGGDSMHADPNGDTHVGTAKVGSHLANTWGLYDMHGHVWERCLDWEGNYTGTESDPKGPAVGTLRVQRGGAYNGNANACRSANREWHRPEKGFVNNGFRLALTLP